MSHVQGRRWRRARGLFTGLVPAVAAPAGACQSWTSAQPPSPGTQGNELKSVAVLSGCNVWAVGDIQLNGPDQALIEHWNGATWTVMPVTQPPNVDYELSGVRAISPTNIWAVGEQVGAEAQTLILHWDGKSRLTVPSKNPGEVNALTSVYAVSAHDVWAVGFSSIKAAIDADHVGFASNQGTQTLILHWNGVKWARVRSPSSGGPDHDDELAAVTAISAPAADLLRPAARTASLVPWRTGRADGGK